MNNNMAIFLSLDLASAFFTPDKQLAGVLLLPRLCGDFRN